MKKENDNSCKQKISSNKNLIVIHEKNSKHSGIGIVSIKRSNKAREDKNRSISLSKSVDTSKSGSVSPDLR